MTGSLPPGVAGDVVVMTPARLHFGLLSFAAGPHPFGGVGMMVDRPRVEIAVRQAERQQIVATKPLQETVARHVAQWEKSQTSQERLNFQLSVMRHPERHVGLGSGTQLGLAIHHALSLFHGHQRPISELATAAKRGLRSSVGCLGFQQGGLIVDYGHGTEGQLASEYVRHEVPPAWRILLACPTGKEGLSGRAEQSAFDALEMPKKTRLHLFQIVHDQILPALLKQDCDAFGDAVYEYGRLSGACFASVQGGCYRSRAIEECVDGLRKAGVHGVGQSSWGPTVFGVVRDLDQAQNVVEIMRRRFGELKIEIAKPDNHGVQATTLRSNAGEAR